MNETAKRTSVEGETYFVASGGDYPERIFFNPIDAFVSGYEYIDSFNRDGDKCESYKFVDNEYVTDF